MAEKEIRNSLGRIDADASSEDDSHSDESSHASQFPVRKL